MRQHNIDQFCPFLKCLWNLKWIMLQFKLLKCGAVLYLLNRMREKSIGRTNRLVFSRISFRYSRTVIVGLIKRETSSLWECCIFIVISGAFFFFFAPTIKYRFYWKNKMLRVQKTDIFLEYQLFSSFCNESQ